MSAAPAPMPPGWAGGSSLNWDRTTGRKRYRRPRHFLDRPHGRDILPDFLYKQLAERLKAIGIHETGRNINNKISRRGFVQCLKVVGCTTLHLEDG